MFGSGWLWVSWFAFAFMLFVVVCLLVVVFMVMFGSVLFINSGDVMLCTLMLFVLYWKSCFVDCGALVGVWGGFCVLVRLLFGSGCWLFWVLLSLLLGAGRRFAGLVCLLVYLLLSCLLYLV